MVQSYRAEPHVVQNAKRPRGDFSEASFSHALVLMPRFDTTQESARAVDTVSLARVHSVSEDKGGIPNSFKVTLKGDDEEEYLFYTDEKEEKETLVSGLRIAANL